MLALALLAAARPARVVELLAGSQPRGVAAAFVVATLVAAARGVRLRVVVGGSLSLRHALGVQAVSQLATAVVPLRLGEAALLPLLHRAGVRGVLRALSFALTVRLLDLVALVAWAAVAGMWVGARGRPMALVLTGLAASLGVVVVLAQRGLALAVQRWRRAAPRWRRLLRQALKARGEFRRLMTSPGRAAAAVALSLAAWTGVWWETVILLRAMDLFWPPASVLWGTLGATLGAALPLNAVGNFGTLEAGWTAALASLGIPPGQALAAGFATHTWSLTFNLVLAALAVPLLHPMASASASFPAPESRRGAGPDGRGQPAPPPPPPSQPSPGR